MAFLRETVRGQAIWVAWFIRLESVHTVCLGYGITIQSAGMPACSSVEGGASASLEARQPYSTHGMADTDIMPLQRVSMVSLISEFDLDKDACSHALCLDDLLLSPWTPLLLGTVRNSPTTIHIAAHHILCLLRDSCSSQAAIVQLCYADNALLRGS
jgi:hypothetical protein